VVEDINAQMAQQIQRICESWQVEAAPQLATGKPYFEIPRLAAKRQAELVVVGAHGEHFLYDMFIGSTAEKVLQCITQPLLIVKQRPIASYGHIMVPLDFSPASEAAMSVRTAYFAGTNVSVVHAYCRSSSSSFR
jgi:Universal stress protein family